MYTTRAGVDGLLRNPDTFIGSKINALGTVSSSPLSLDPTAGDTITITPGASLTINAANVTNGQDLTFIITTSGVTSFTLTFGTNFKSTGTLATGIVSGKVFTISFRSDGTNFNELGRTTAM